MTQLLSINLVLLIFALCSGQPRSLAPNPEGPNCFNREEISNVISAYYRIISGPSGSRDWDKFRTLSLETARFDAVGINEKGQNQFHPQSRDEYINHITEYLRKYGFFQSELKRTIECYARVAHVLVTYESRNEVKGNVIDRGVMSFQLVYDDGRWRIAHVMWNSETREHPIPARYLK